MMVAAVTEGIAEVSEFLKGRLVDLVPLERHAYAILNRRWTNDPLVCRFLYRGMFPTTVENHFEAFDRTRAASNEFELFIRRRTDNAVVGITGLHTIFWPARSAEFRILIGERDAWGHGFGGEALGLLCRYAFQRLNLNRIWLGVNALNEQAIASYRKAGFVVEGVLREDFFVEGRYCDTIRMSLLQREFNPAAFGFDPEA